MDNGKIKNIAMNDNGFIYDPETGYSYNSNQLGFYLLKLMQAGKNRTEITHTILKEYDTTLDQFNSDFDYFLLQLKSFSLIEE